MSIFKIPGFHIIFNKDTQKQYNKLSNTIKPKLAKSLASLSQSPFKGKKLGGDLSGLRSLRFWPYRVLYEVNISKREIRIHKISHRQGAYK